MTSTSIIYVALLSRPSYPLSHDTGLHLEENRVETLSRSPEDTQSIGKTLGAHALPGHVLLLIGELGAGKTCLTQGVLWGLGGGEYARSPTFVMAAQYTGRLTLYHMDLYRVDSAAELTDLGLDEYLYGDGVSVVEWADRVPGLMPRDHLQIQIEHAGETERRLTLSASAPEYEDLLNAVKSDRPNG